MKFARWRSGEIDPFELSDEIHRFHDGVSRELYNLYGNLPPHQSVPRALARKILQETDVPPELLAALGEHRPVFPRLQDRARRAGRGLKRSRLAGAVTKRVALALAPGP